MPYLPFDGKNSPSIPFTLNRASPQAVGLVAWWTALAERGAGMWRERVVGSTATFTGTITWESDPELGSRLNFSRAGTSYIVTGIAAQTAAPFSLAAWIRPTNGATYRSIMGCTSNGGIEWRLSNTSHLELLQQSTALIATSTGTVTNDATNHVAFTYASGGVWTFYINGFASGTGTNSVTFTAGNIDLGHHPTLGGEEYDGAMADVRIYNRALSAAEVWQLYAPQTRWDLYRVTPFAGAPSIAATVVSGAIRMPLLGVG